MPLSKKDCDSHNFESAYVMVSYEEKKHSFFFKRKMIKFEKQWPRERSLLVNYKLNYFFFNNFY